MNGVEIAGVKWNIIRRCRKSFIRDGGSFGVVELYFVVCFLIYIVTLTAVRKQRQRREKNFEFKRERKNQNNKN